jgi:tricorn protease-like protein
MNKKLIQKLGLCCKYVAKQTNHSKPGWYITASFIEYDSNLHSWCVDNLKGYYNIYGDIIYMVDDDDLFLFKLTWGFDDSK